MRRPTMHCELSWKAKLKICDRRPCTKQNVSMWLLYVVMDMYTRVVLVMQNALLAQLLFPIINKKRNTKLISDKNPDDDQLMEWEGTKARGKASVQGVGGRRKLMKTSTNLTESAFGTLKFTINLPNCTQLGRTSCNLSNSVIMT